MRIFTCSLFSLLFLFYNQTQAQIYEKLNGPYGGGSKVFEARNGILFQFVTENDVHRIVYKSIDGGGSWKRMPMPPSSQVYDPIGVGYDGNLYGAENEKLYTSTNDGQSWSLINSPTSNAVNTITALPNGILLVSDYYSVFQSANGGQTWTSSSPQGINSFYYNKYTNQTYAISGTKMYVSNDSGLSWQLFFADDFENKTSFACSANGFVFVSGLGYIWKLNTTGTLLRKISPVFSPNYAVNIALSTANRLFADVNNNSLYSDDYGDNWTPFLPKGIDTNIFSQFSTTSNGSVFGVKITGSVYVSTDNGVNWAFSAIGINDALVYELEFLSENHIVALTSDGLFYSEDSGQSWNFIFFSNLNLPLYDKSDRIVHFGDEFYFSDATEIYYFKDGKTKSTKIRKKSTPNYSDKLFLNPKTSTMFSMESPNQIYKSNDRGITWKLIPINQIGDLHSFADGSIIATRINGIYRSSDNGDSWTQILNYNFPGSNQILSDGFVTAFIYVSGNTLKLLKSIDNGLSWNLIPIKNPNAVVLEPANGQACNNLGQLFSASLTGEVYRSVDQGVSYSVYIDGISLISGIDFSPQQKLYLFTNQNGLWRTKISTSSTKILTGNVFTDTNKDCVKDPGEANQPGRLVEAVNGNQKLYSYSDANGDFRMPIDQGDYSLSVFANNAYLTSCTKTISATTYNFNDTLHLGLQINSICPFMRVSLQSTILRRCMESILYIDYSNTGTQKAKDAYVDITLDPLFDFVSSSIPFVSQNGNVYRFSLGDVDENVSGYFSIRVNVSCKASMGQIHCAEAHIYPDSPCVHSGRAIIRTSANCLGDSVELIIKNDGNQNMTVAKNWWVIDLSNSNNNIQSFDGGSFYLNAGQVFTKRIASRARILLVAEQDDSYPYNKTSKTAINYCSQNPLPGSPPLSISNLDNEEPFDSKFCDRNRGSFDPNEIKGSPEGISNQHYVNNAQELDYIICFQNTGTDTAFNVRIENQLPLKQLDLSTFVPGASSHPYHITMNADGKLIFSFSHILLPDSSINETASHGFIQYSIKPIDKLANGTQILNDAEIYFDFNNGVNTNIDLHTIGSPIPVQVNNVGQSSDIDFQIVPNPMQESSLILIKSNSKNESYKLSCTDVYSKLLWQIEFVGNETRMSRGDLLPGIYFLTLRNDKEQAIQIKKLIIK